MVLAHFTRVPYTEFCRAEQAASKDSHKMCSFTLQFCHEDVQKPWSPTWTSVRHTATPLTCDSTDSSTESQQRKLQLCTKMRAVEGHKDGGMGEEGEGKDH